MFKKEIKLFYLIMLFLFVGCASQISRNKICNFTKFNYIDTELKDITLIESIGFLPSYSEPDAEYLAEIFDKTLKENINICDNLKWEQIPLLDNNLSITSKTIFNKINTNQSIESEINNISQHIKTKYIAINFIKKYEPKVANSIAVNLPGMSMVNSQTFYRNGFISNIRIFDTESGLLAYDMHLEAFSDNNESRFFSDDSLYVDKAISNLICELFYLPKYKNNNKLNRQTLSREKIVLSEIVDEYFMNMKNNSKNKYKIRKKTDYSLLYYLTDDEIQDALNHFSYYGVIRKFTFDSKNTNSPGFSVEINPYFFE